MFWQDAGLPVPGIANVGVIALEVQPAFSIADQLQLQPV